MEEIWKDVPGYEDRYQVSNLCRVRSKDRYVRKNFLRKGKLLKPSLNTQGYLWFSTWKGQHLRVHRAVALAFIPNPNNYPFVNHKDGNKLNNSIINLEWCTVQMNSQHAYDLGLHVKLCSDSAKLKKHEILEIKKLLTTAMLNKDIAAKYKISTRTVLDIRKGKTWAHIKDDGSENMEKDGRSYKTKPPVKLIVNTDLDKRNKKVILVSTGEVFSNISLAAKCLNKNINAVSRALRGERPNNTGLEYMI